MVTKNVYVVFFLNLVKHLCTGKATNAVTNKWRKNTNFCSAFFTKTDCFQCVYALHDQFVPTKTPKNKPTKEWNLGGFFKFIFIYFFIYFFVTLCIKALNPHTERCLFLSSVSHCAVQMTWWQTKGWTSRLQWPTSCPPAPLTSSPVPSARLAWTTPAKGKAAPPTTSK